MFCKSCGNQLGPNALFCTKCGTKTAVAPQPAAPAQPAFTPQPAAPEKPAFTASQPETPIKTAFDEPQPAAPAQPAFTAPQQPAFQQPVYVSPAASAAPAGGTDTVRTVMYFITLLVVCALTVGLFIGKVYKIGPKEEYETSRSTTESRTIWEGYHNHYETLERQDADGILFIKAVKNTYKSISKSIDYYSERDRNAYVIALFFLMIAMPLAVLAALLSLIFVIVSIVFTVNKKEPKAWLMLMASLAFILLAQLCALGYVISLKVAQKDNIYTDFSIHWILLLSLAATIAFLVLASIFKGRAGSQKRPAPSFAYPTGGQFPMQ